MLKNLIKIFLIIFFVFIIIDVILKFVLPKSKFFHNTVDIQNFETLFPKLSKIYKSDKIKIILVGDSLIFGQSMKIHGNLKWQNYTLSSQIMKIISTKYPNCSFDIVNLGMNGLLPKDLFYLSKSLTNVSPDLLIFDVSLRSFSSDFITGKNTMSRSWLKSNYFNRNGKF